MPRSLAAALFGIGFVLSCALTVPPTVFAAEPAADPFLDIAGDFGLECEETSERNWGCYEPNWDDPRQATILVSDAGSSLYVAAHRLLYGAEGLVPAEPDLYAALERLITTALDDSDAALAWLADMNAGPSEAGEFSREGWRLWWSVQTVDGADVPTAELELVLEQFPDGSSPSTSAPAPSFAAASFAPHELAGSSLGQWTYEGAWTLTSFVNDVEGGNPEQAIGTSLPGSFELSCPALDSPCSMLSTREDLPFVGGALELLEDGRLSAARETELDNCADGQVRTERFEVQHGMQRAVVHWSQAAVPRTCDDGDGTLYSFDQTWVFDGVLTAHVPAEGPRSSAGAAPGPAAPAAPDGPDATSSRGFAASLPTPAEISTDPIVLVQSAALAALLVFLMPFPSQLFNSTLETHEAEVRRWLRLDRVGAVVGGIGAFWVSWPGVIAFTLLAALLYGFLDPGFGIDLGSVATFLGMLLGIVLVTVAFAVPSVLAHRRHGDRPSLKVVPVSLLIGVGCVLLSRLTDFQPGYLYGLLIGLAFARELSEAEEGRSTAVGAIAMLAVAMLAWFGLGALPAGDGFGLVVAQTALAALMVAGLEGVVFGLLPMRFLPGEPLYRWNRVLWAGLLLIGAFAFFHILINPASGYLSDTSRTPLLTVLALLIGFGLVSVAFWSWFRFRPTAAEAEA